MTGNYSLSNQVNSSGGLYLVGNEQAIGFGANSNLANVFVQGNGNKVLASDLTITSLISFTGNNDFLTNENTLLLTNNVEVSGAGTNAHIVGSLSRRGGGNMFFPIGTTNKYAPRPMKSS